jgi:hypothetical protein
MKKKESLKLCRNYNEIKTDLSGSGFADNIKKTLNIKLELPNSSKLTMQKYAYIPIKKLEVFKTPLNNILQITALAVSKANTGQDKLYHVGLIATLDNGVKIYVEKNQTFIITDTYDMKDSSEFKDVPLSMPINLYQLVGRALKKFGPEQMFKYSALGSKNCQNAVLDMLDASNLLTPDLRDFIYQDLTVLKENTPQIVQNIVQGVTDLAAKFSNITGQGAELEGGVINKNKKKLYSIKLNGHVYDDNTIEIIGKLHEVEKETEEEEKLKLLKDIRDEQLKTIAKAGAQEDAKDFINKMNSDIEKLEKKIEKNEDGEKKPKTKAQIKKDEIEKRKMERLKKIEDKALEKQANKKIKADAKRFEKEEAREEKIKRREEKKQETKKRQMEKKESKIKKPKGRPKKEENKIEKKEEKKEEKKNKKEDKKEDKLEEEKKMDVFATKTEKKIQNGDEEKEFEAAQTKLKKIKKSLEEYVDEIDLFKKYNKASDKEKKKLEKQFQDKFGDDFESVSFVIDDLLKKQNKIIKDYENKYGKDNDLKKYGEELKDLV